MEIKVGQKWRTRAGETVEIVVSETCVTKYPHKSNRQYWYDRNGRAACGEGVQHEQDLIELITDDPPQAHPPAEPAASALDVQIGGGHYKGKSIQPVQYIHANSLNFLEGCIVKRITRWRDKNGVQDLLKIKHEVDLLIELEGLDPNAA